MLAGLLLLTAASAAAQDGHADPAIERWIAAHAGKSKGAEHRNSRRAATGDLDGDGLGDVAVLYTIEADKPNGYSLRYLAVFRRGADGLGYEAHRLVGGRGIREINRVTVLNRVIVLESLEYRPRDAVCCPSKPARWRYRLRDHQLVEARSAGSKAKQKSGKQMPAAPPAN
ncbi:MAG: hypothetical protein HYV99_02780 [Betaproteobacteria bacterium]|nr:hypothetical protein [Betaproteobacteria bacterium]